MFLSLPAPPPTPIPNSRPALRRGESREDAMRPTHQLAAKLPETWRGTESQGWRGQGCRLHLHGGAFRGCLDTRPAARGRAGCATRASQSSSSHIPRAPESSSCAGLRKWEGPGAPAMAGLQDNWKSCSAFWTLKTNKQTKEACGSFPGHCIGTGASGGDEG